MQFTLGLTTLLLANCCFAVELNCGNLDAAACKEKFAAGFNNEFKTLHHAAFRKLCQTYMDISTKVVEELDKTDLFHALTDLSIQNVAQDLDEFEKNTNDEKKVAEITNAAIAHMEFTFEKGTADPEHFREVCKKHKLRESLADVVKELNTDIGKLWTEMYKILRASDLTAYPQYETINTSMKKLEKFTAELREENDGDTKEALKVIGIDLEIPFYDAILEFS